MVNRVLTPNELVQRAEALIDIEMLECPSQDTRYQEIIRIMAEAAPSFHSNSPSKEPPPLKIVAWTLCNLAFPDFSAQMTPRFLDLLASVEFYRDMNLKETKHFFPNIFEDEGEVKRSGRLNQNLEDKLIECTHETDGLRESFWNIVIACCIQHLTYLSNKPSLTDFWEQFQEYFFFLVDSGRSPLEFHHEMSQDERDLLREAAGVCISESVTAKQHGKSVAPSQLMHYAGPMILHYVQTVCRQQEVLEEAISSL